MIDLLLDVIVGVPSVILALASAGAILWTLLKVLGSMLDSIVPPRR